MRRLLLAAGLAFSCLCGSGIGNAEGLLYELPDDGMWVQHNLKVSRGDLEMTGTLRLCSVGQVTVEQDVCRWIEVKMTLEAPANKEVIAKVLIPEKFLQPGKDPLKHRIRGWIRMAANAEVMVLTPEKLGPLQVFVSGPLQEVKTLAPEEISSKSRKIVCEGLTGNLNFEDVGKKMAATLTVRRQQRIPFGVISSHITIDKAAEDRDFPTVTLETKVADFGSGAQSALPDSQ